MDLNRISEIIVETLQSALYEPQYQFGIPKKGESDKVASGSLRDSIEAIPSKDGIFVFMNSYGKYVNSGRQKGKYVPIKPLEDWIRSRGLQGKDKNGKPISNRSFAYAISRTIYKKGIPALPFGWMDFAIEQLYENKELESLLAEMSVDDLINQLQGI